MSDNVVVLPVIRVDRSNDAPFLPEDDLLRRLQWAQHDSVDDDRPGIALVLQDARAEIIRLQVLVSTLPKSKTLP